MLELASTSASASSSASSPSSTVYHLQLCHHYHPYRSLLVLVPTPQGQARRPAHQRHHPQKHQRQDQHQPCNILIRIASLTSLIHTFTCPCPEATSSGPSSSASCGAAALQAPSYLASICSSILHLSLYHPQLCHIMVSLLSSSSSSYPDQMPEAGSRGAKCWVFDKARSNWVAKAPVSNVVPLPSPSLCPPAPSVRSPRHPSPSFPVQTVWSVWGQADGEGWQPHNRHDHVCKCYE